MKSRQFSHEGEICVKTSKDKISCQIIGMTLLTPDLLIITDCDNNAVKMVDTSSQSVSDQLQQDDEPWDITRLTSTELAVTLPDIQTIQFISISSNKLIKKHTMKVGGKCHGISCYQDIWSITCNRSSIYVSDWGMKTVTRLNWQGDVIGSYSGMSIPMGMSLSDEGTVFLCDWERNYIKEISGDCSTGKVVMQNLERPRAVCWCGKTKKLYYSCLAFNDDNFLQIYKLS
ncbi:uncharacterized protein LOC132731223 [Ruditapes philippinarum]|uniref:uncharacterized protein LOC132731223 n=1 Tax=Ruditapes philippinarum TaxID=129788 RepID=UPI00295C3128|nr:uncharacterized protein LOC132731223 [Ruditapes philippinarum]